MSSVIKDKSEWVFENSNSLIETDAMFSNVTFGFCWIPLESHICILLHEYLYFKMILFQSISGLTFCSGGWPSGT